MPTFPTEDDRVVLDPGCDRCPALVESRTCIAWGTAPPGVEPADADLLVVGEAPGAGDPDADRWRGGNHTGMAYTTRHSGRRVRELFDELGYGDRAYYTNAVKCFPADGDGGNREPTDGEREACRTHLEAELELVDPRVVVATGKHATVSMLALEDRELDRDWDLDGFVETVLEPVPMPSQDTTLLPIFHPSYQDVWIARLGYTPEGYREAIREALSAV